MASALSGKRIVVTRRAVQAASFCEHLRALGAVPISFPTIELTALPADELDIVMDVIEIYDWLIFSSANAVRFFFASISEPSSELALPSIAVVGSATAEVLSEYGHLAVAMPNSFTGEALALSLGTLTGRRVLLPRAKQGRPEILSALRAAGATVDDIALYDTVKAQPRPEAFTAIEAGVDVLTFTSPLTAQNFYKLIDPPIVSSAVVACIGRTTADTVRDLGVRVHVVPPVYTIAGLTDALVQYFQEREIADAIV